MHVVALVADLMDQTRMAAVAANAGAEIRFVRTPSELEVREGELVLVDLRLDGSIGAVTGLPDGAEVVGFGPHVDAARLKAARAAGCRRVLARSAFFEQLPALLSDGAGGHRDSSG